MMNFNANNNAGFGRSGSLLSNLRFSGVCRIAEKSVRVKIGRNGEEDVKYYIIRDEFGAQFSTFDEKLFEAAIPSESMLLEGKVRISKGNTYLNLTKVAPIHGEDLRTKWDNQKYVDVRRQEMVDMDMDTVFVTKWEQALKDRQFGTLTELELQLDEAILTAQGVPNFAVSD